MVIFNSYFDITRGYIIYYINGIINGIPIDIENGDLTTIFMVI